MDKFTLSLPKMYADHHVTEVRRILLELPGVVDVYASSCFHIAEVTYDPSQMDSDRIKARLAHAGYLGDQSMPLEAGVAASSTGGAATFMRHTASYQQTGRVIGFAQTVADTGRALWPCPGMEPVQTKDEQDG